MKARLSNVLVVVVAALVYAGGMWSLIAFVLTTFTPRTAEASNIPKFTADVATVKRWCTSQSSTNGQPIIGLQCDEPVRILTGSSLSDGGTRQTSDGGMPITPTADNKVERLAFPGDVAPIRLAPNEKCIGVISADAGANGCIFFDVSPL